MSSGRPAAKELRRSSRVVSPVPQPDQEDGDTGDNGDAEIQILDVVDQLVPVLAELVANAGNHAHPQQGTEEVEQGKTLPLHTEHASKRTGNHTQAKDKACKENRDRAIFIEETLSASNRVGRNPKQIPVAIEQRTPAAITDREAEIISERRGAHAYEDDVSELELVPRKSEEAGKQEDGFARDRDAGILEQQRNCDRPVAIVSDIVLESLKNSRPLVARERSASILPRHSRKQR